MIENEEVKLGITKAINILHNNNCTKCSSCGHRTEEIFNPCGIMQCNVTCLTMCNDKGVCIWYQKGKPFSKELDIELAKSRMVKGSRIYFSRGDYIDA